MGDGSTEPFLMRRAGWRIGVPSTGNEPATKSHRQRRQISTEDEDQIVRLVALVVLCAGNHLDALAVAYEGVRQAAVFAVAGAPIPQCLVADLTQDVFGAVPHPEIHALEP